MQYNSNIYIINAKLSGSKWKISNEAQGPHVFFFPSLVMLGTMNLLALLP